MEEKSVLEMAKGAITERFDAEVIKVIDNILDPNTEPCKKRTISLTVDFVPTKDRGQVYINAIAKSKLIPNDSVQTSIYVGTSSDGELQAYEMTKQAPGQLGMDGKEQEEPTKIRLVSGGSK